MPYSTKKKKKMFFDYSMEYKKLHTAGTWATGWKAMF